ncbi:uncharacterized protein Dwil_GK12440 [Drosophila willistoni]|uniref:Uncharacterized protein n=1 Tax=Drosophila willistoni TaxID=7260 RepID=B4NGK1_DROWI|nr:uncharacterized protein Dwil_GK12440 [Drosophila willistoni]
MNAAPGKLVDQPLADVRRQLRRKRILDGAKTRLEKLNGKTDGNAPEIVRYSDPEVEPNVPGGKYSLNEFFDATPKKKHLRPAGGGGPRPSGFSSNGSTENPSEHRLDPHEGITNILDDSFPKDSGKELGSKHQIHRSSLVKLRISERKVKRILLHLIRDGAGRKCFSYTRQHHGDCLEPSQRFVRRRNL